MTKEERCKIAVEYKKQMNCCQAVTKAFSDMVSLDENTLQKYFVRIWKWNGKPWGNLWCPRWSKHNCRSFCKWKQHYKNFKRIVKRFLKKMRLHNLQRFKRNYNWLSTLLLRQMRRKCSSLIVSNNRKCPKSKSLTAQWIWC